MQTLVVLAVQVWVVALLALLAVAAVVYPVTATLNWRAARPHRAGSSALPAGPLAAELSTA